MSKIYSVRWFVSIENSFCPRKSFYKRVSGTILYKLNPVDSEVVNCHHQPSTLAILYSEYHLMSS